MKKTKHHTDGLSIKPKHEKLPWPGLRAKGYLSRVVTRAVKEAKEMRENEAWAQSQIARVLNYVSPEIAMKLILRECHRRRRRPSQFVKILVRLLETRESSGIIEFDHPDALIVFRQPKTGDREAPQK